MVAQLTTTKQTYAERYRSAMQPSVMASSDKLWPYEQVGGLISLVNSYFNFSRKVKIKDSEYARKLGIGGDCSFNVSKVLCELQ